MLFGGWIGTMAGLSRFSTNGGLAYMDRWPPLVPPIELYGAPEEDGIPEKWRNFAKHARKKRIRKKWQNKIRHEIKKQQKGDRRYGRYGNN